MDWPCTAGYVRAIAEHLGIPIYFPWREGGFARELDRNDAPTAPIRFETPDGLSYAGGNGPAGTCGLFPQTSADLLVPKIPNGGGRSSCVVVASRRRL